MGLEAKHWNREQFKEVLNAKLPDALACLKQWVRISSYTLDVAGIEALALQIGKDFERLGFEATRLPSTDERYADHWMLERKGSMLTHNLWSVLVIWIQFFRKTNACATRLNGRKQATVSMAREPWILKAALHCYT